MKNSTPFLIFISIGLHCCQPREARNTEIQNLSDKTTLDTLPVETKENFDLKSFPSEWVMLTNLLPDTSIVSDFAVMLNTDGSYYGEIKVKANQLFISNGTLNEWFEIQQCQRKQEVEMVYYYFDLLSVKNKTALKVMVNYRAQVANSSWFFGDEVCEFTVKSKRADFKTTTVPDE